MLPNQKFQASGGPEWGPVDTTHSQSRRCEQNLNLCGEIPLDFESNTLAAPSQLPDVAKNPERPYAGHRLSNIFCTFLFLVIFVMHTLLYFNFKSINYTVNIVLYKLGLYIGL